jgi:hypothetical protein
MTEIKKKKPDISILRALADIPDTIEIAGVEYKIYPMTPGKLALLDDKMTAFVPLLGYLDIISIGTDDEAKALFSGKIKEAIEPIVDAFFILTAPNNGKQPVEPDKEIREALKWQLEIPQLIKILFILKQQGQFETMLKNVFPLKEQNLEQEPETSTGEPSSVGSNDLQDGL